MQNLKIEKIKKDKMIKNILKEKIMVKIDEELSLARII